MAKSCGATQLGADRFSYPFTQSYELATLRVASRAKGGVMRIAIGFIMVALLASACESGFTDADIEQTKKNIREEFENRPGVKVADVQLIKESRNKLTGFVKLNTSVLGVSVDATKSCTATMGENRQYIWRCE